MTIKKNKEQTLSSLFCIISELEKITQEYLNGFDINSSFSFSNNEEARNGYLHTYRKFTSTLKENIEKCEQQMALISEILFKADRAHDKDLADELMEHFNKYTLFSLAVSGFIENTERLFLDRENEFRPIVVASRTRELLAAIQNYKENM